MIGFYLHHHGSGHRVRGTRIARHLTAGPAGARVIGLGTGPAPKDWPGDWIDLPDDAVPTPSAELDLTAAGVFHYAPVGHPGFCRRQTLIAASMAAYDVRLLHVDVSIEVALLARLLGVAVSVGAMPGDRSDRPHALAYDVADLVVAPWPAGAHGLDTSAWSAKTEHVGGISRFGERGAAASAPSAPSARPPRARPRVLVLGGTGGSDITSADIEQAAAATPGWEWVARGGHAAHSRDLWTDLLDADVVVTHAGQNAVADVACARRPAVVIAHTRPFGEQAATADAIERLGIAPARSRWPSAGEWPGLLEDAARGDPQRWSRWLGGGAAQAAAALQRLHHRQTSPERSDDPRRGSAA